MLVRVRPATANETTAGGGMYRKSVAVDGKALTYEGAKGFTFDACCDEGSTQVSAAGGSLRRQRRRSAAVPLAGSHAPRGAVRIGDCHAR